MKYRVQNGCLYLGDKQIGPHPLSGFIECQHEAAVEFWQENERLQSLNAELLAACKDVSEFLEKKVRELGLTYDWLGTGSDSRHANREEREWESALNANIANIKAVIAHADQKGENEQ